MATIAKKICLAGDFSVGKTSLIARFVHQTFSEKYLSTLGVKIDSKTIEVDDKTNVKLVIWDIAGKDSFTTTDQNYLRGVTAYILAIDSTRYQTLNTALTLKKQITERHGDLPAVCVLNKVDLVDDWDLSESQINELQFPENCLFRTSAKTGENVEAVFFKLASLLAE